MRFAKILSLVVFSLIIYQLIGVYNTMAYQTSFIFSGNVTPANNTNYLYVSEIKNGNCNINLNSYAATSGTTYTITNSFYFPYNTLLGTSSVSKTGTKSCNFYGNFSNIINSNVILDTRLSYIDTATTRNTSLITNLICNADSITLLSNGTTLSNGFKMDNYIYVAGLANIIQAVNNLTKCVPFSPYGIFKTNRFTVSDSVPSGRGMGYIYPFNTGNGNIYIQINETSICNTNDEWFIFEKGQISYNLIGVGLANFVSNLTLSENTDYILAKYCSVNNPQVVDTPTVRITIGTYEPIWDCVEYGDCINGTKQRLCIEHNGKLPNKLEFEVCYSAPDKILNIGFEDSINANVFYSQPTWFCLLGVNEKNVEYPKNWNVNTVTNPMYNNSATSHIAYIFDNIKMTNEDSTEGIKSLKLWYLPPQQYLPQCNNETGTCPINLNGTQCTITPYGNYSCGNAPQIERDINETWLVSKNLTFNYPNITLSFDARKCSSPEQEWSGNASLFGVCGEGYYTNDKSSNWPISNTMIYYSIYDYNTSSMVYIGSGEVKTNLWDSFELLLINLDVTHLYQLQINLLLSSETTSNVYCAMIDNVNINAYSGAVRCMSYCDDERTYRALVSQDQYGCSFTFTRMSPKCFDLSISPLISGCSPNICPICEVGQPDYLTLYSGDNSTGVCKWTFTENSDYCANYCSTQKLISDNPLAQDIAVYFQFFNPIWIITFIIMGIGAFLAYKIKDWHIFAIAVIVGFFISAVVWIEMAFIAICIMIVVAYFMFKDMSSK